MSKKTNKTSHVMDLLTNGASTEADASVNEAVSGQEKKAADVQSHTVSPAKVTVVDEGSRNDRLSQEILGKLTEELEEENRRELGAHESKSKKPEAAEQTAVNQAPQGEEAGGQEFETASPDLESQNEQTQEETDSLASQESLADTPLADPAEAVQESMHDASQPLEGSIQDTVPQPSPEPSQGSSDVSAASQLQEEAPQAAAAPVPDSSPSQPQENAAAPGKAPAPHPIIPESQLNSRFQDKEYRFINVMEQLLMRQNLEAVLTQYEVCTCPRCMSDVCALALTGLPSKYVVTSRDSISPLISYYENKYKISVLTELMKACNKVRQNPRHKVEK